MYHQILVRNRKHLFLNYSKVRRPYQWYLFPFPLTLKYSKYAHSINWDSSIAFQANALEKLIVFDSYFFYGALSTQSNVAKLSAKLSLLSRIRVNIETTLTRKVVSLIETCNNLGQKKRVSLCEIWGAQDIAAYGVWSKAFSFLSKKSCSFNILAW